MTGYTIITEKGDGNCSACCLDLPGVVAAAETEGETAELMRDAIEFHLSIAFHEAFRADGHLGGARIAERLTATGGFQEIKIPNGLAAAPFLQGSPNNLCIRIFHLFKDLEGSSSTFDGFGSIVELI